MKKTSYKKLSKLLSTFEKKASSLQPSFVWSSYQGLWGQNIVPNLVRQTIVHRPVLSVPLIMQGLLSTKVIHKQDKLASVNREHELYHAHAPSSAASAAPSCTPAAAKTPAADVPSSSGRITVSYSYRSDPHLPHFMSIGPYPNY